MPLQNTENQDVLFKDILQTLNTHLKDVKILYDIDMNADALIRAKRCRELIEFADIVTQRRRGFHSFNHHSWLRWMR